MSDDTPQAAEQPTTPRETIEVAVGPNVDGHTHQAVAAQTRPDEQPTTTEMAERAASDHPSEG
jgi:hypothetical protein